MSFFDDLFNEESVKKLKREEMAAVPAGQGMAVPATMIVTALLFAVVAVWVIGQLGKRPIPIVPAVTPMWLVTIPPTPQETPTLAATATASLLPTVQPSHTPLPAATASPNTVVPLLVVQTPLPAVPDESDWGLWLWGLVVVWFLSGVAVAGILYYYRRQQQSNVPANNVNNNVPAHLPIVVYPSEPVHSAAAASTRRVRLVRRSPSPAPPPTAVARIITHPPAKPVTVVVNTNTTASTIPTGDSPVNTTASTIPAGDSPVNTTAGMTPAGDSPVNTTAGTTPAGDVVTVGVVGEVFRFPYRGGWAEVETPFQSQAEPTAEQVAAVRWLAGVRVGGVPVSRNFVIGRFFRSRGSRPAQFIRKCLHANSGTEGG